MLAKGDLNICNSYVESKTPDSKVLADFWCREAWCVEIAERGIVDAVKR